jgi:hypothetical protein
LQQTFFEGDFGMWNVGDILPLSSGPFTFTLPAAGMVEFGGIWSWLMVNSIVDTALELSIDGGAWFPPSGGGSDLFGVGAGISESYSPEYWCGFLPKGEHTIDIRFVVKRVPTKIANGALVAVAAGSWWVTYLYEICREEQL